MLPCRRLRKAFDERRFRMKSLPIELVSHCLHPLLRTPPAPPPHETERPRVLVIKPASLGDVLMSTAFLAALRANLPDAEITVLVTTWAKEALAGNPHCDRLLDSGSVGFPGRYGLRAYRNCVSRVRQERFTHCFVLDRSPLMALLPRLAGIPWRAGLNSARRGIALHVGVPCPDERHEVELYLDVLRAVGYEALAPRLHFQPQPPAELAVSNLLAEKGLANKRPLVAVHAGGGRNPGAERISKRWSSGGFAALAERLARDAGAEVVLVGGSDDAPANEAVQRGAPAPLLDLAGTLTFAQLGALLRRCSLFIGNDSAPMHLAAAVGTPVVALFGPTSPERYGPYGVASAVARFDPDRRGASSESEIDAVWRTARRLLHARSHSERANPS